MKASAEAWRRLRYVFLSLVPVLALILVPSAYAVEEGAFAEFAFHQAYTGNAIFGILPSGSKEEARQLVFGPKAAAGTDPSAAAACLGCEINDLGGALAVNAEDGTQWIRRIDNEKWENTGRGFAPGTSPSVKWGPGGRTLPAFNAQGSEALWIGEADLGYPLEAHSTPDETGGNGEGGDYWAAWAKRGSDELELWHQPYKGSEYTVSTGLGIEPGTNPSITELHNGEVVVAFVAQGLKQLGIYKSGASGWFDTGLGLDESSSPSVTEWGLKTSGYLVAFQAAGSQHVGVYQNGWEPGRWLDSGLAMQGGTSPCITTREYTWDVAFQGAGSHFFWTWDSAAGGRDWEFPVGEHSSPVIAGESVN